MRRAAARFRRARWVEPRRRGAMGVARQGCRPGGTGLCPPSPPQIAGSGTEGPGEPRPRRRTAAKAKLATESEAAMTRNRVWRDDDVQRLGGGDEAERARERGDRHHGRHHLGPQRPRRPHGEDADDRRVHERRREAEAADDDRRRSPRHRDREEIDRDRHPEDGDGGHLQQVGLRRELLRGERAEQRAGAEAAEEEADDVRVPVVVGSTRAPARRRSLPSRRG